MTKASRNQRKRQRARGQRNRPSAWLLRPRTLLAYLLPFAALAAFAIWMLCQDALQHYREHGYVHFSTQLLVVAMGPTGVVVLMLAIWLYERKRARGKRQARR